MTRSYYAPHGGHPPQTELLTGRAVFTEAYAVIPYGVMSDIVTSLLPGWTDTRVWILARPLSGFAETFAHYLHIVDTVETASTFELHVRPRLRQRGQSGPPAPTVIDFDPYNTLDLDRLIAAYYPKEGEAPAEGRGPLPAEEVGGEATVTSAPAPMMHSSPISA